MSDARRSGRAGAAAATFAQAIGIVAGALTSFVLARELGAEGTGIYAVAAQLVLTAMMASAIGLRTGIAHEVSAGRLSSRSAATEAIALSALLGSIGGVAAFGAYELGTDSAFEGIDGSIAVVLCASVPFAVTSWVLAAIPLAEKNYIAYALLQASSFTLICALVVPLTLLFELDGALIAFSSSVAIAAVGSAVWPFATLPGRAARAARAGTSPTRSGSASGAGRSRCSRSFRSDPTS